MALSLSVPTEFGITATYHRIAAVQANWADSGCSVMLFSYIDKTARDANAKPLGSVQVQLPTALAGDGDITRDALYTLIKAEPEWTNAINI